MRQFLLLLSQIVVIGCAHFPANIAMAQEIALTFDDAPRDSTQRFSGLKRSEVLLKNLKKAKVDQVAFFANTSRATGEGLARLISYGKDGHLIANHTHSHPDLNKTPSSDYIAEIQITDQMLSALPGFIKWFRFPFLREGSDLEKRNTVRAYLSEQKYKNAYVTVNNYDWAMDALLQKALTEGKSVNYETLKNLYVEILLDCIDFYDRMAQESLGRSPKHVLLLHENDINALFIGDLVDALRSRQWKIISPIVAYTDKISEVVTSNLFKNNPGRIGEIASDAGAGNSRGGLWHVSCSESYLASLFEKRGVFKSQLPLMGGGLAPTLGPTPKPLGL